MVQKLRKEHMDELMARLSERLESEKQAHMAKEAEFVSRKTAIEAKWHRISVMQEAGGLVEVGIVV